MFAALNPMFKSILQLSAKRINEPFTIFNRELYLSINVLNNNTTENPRNLAIKSDFNSTKQKTKNVYLDTIKIFNNRDIHRRGHVEFIYMAMKHMEEFGVHKDLDVYKALIDVLPKGKFIPQNMMQAAFMHYPKQQQCAVDLLEQMEDNGII